MVRRISYWVILCALCLAMASGCGIGIRQGVQSVSMPPEEGSLCPSCESGKEVNATFGYREIRVLDWSGLMMSAITTAGSADTARREAVERARARGETGVITYEYDVTPVVPGLRSELLLRFAGDEIPYEYGGTGFDFGERSYFGMDLKADFTPHYIGQLPLIFQVTVAGRLERYDVAVSSTWNTGYGMGEFHGDVYVGMAWSWTLNQNMVLRSDTEAGIVSPLMKLIGYGTLSYSTGLEFNYLPFEWLTVQAYGRLASHSLTSRGSNLWMAGVGITLNTPQSWVDRN